VLLTRPGQKDSESKEDYLVSKNPFGESGKLFPFYSAKSCTLPFAAGAARCDLDHIFSLGISMIAFRISNMCFIDQSFTIFWSLALDLQYT
jgi:hypothetical protein